MPRKIIDTITINSSLNRRLLDLTESLASSIQDSVIQYCQFTEPINGKYQAIFDISKDMISLLRQEKWNTEDARAIGNKLNQLDLIHPENLWLVQKSFLSSLAHNFPDQELLIIYPRICLLIIDIISGFVKETQDKIFLAQEQIRSQIEKAKDDAENARQQIETRHNLIVENIPERIIIIDLEGNVIFYHPGYRNPSQLARNMERINIKNFIPKEIYAEFFEKSNRALSTGENQILTTSFPFQNRVRVFEGRIAPYTEDKTITIIRDITDLVESQNALKISQSHLQEMTRQLIATQESERHQIALDLHDQVLSQLGALFIFVDDATIPRQFIDNYHKLVDQIRATIYNLRPPMVNYGLYPALEDLHTYLCNHNDLNTSIIFNVSPSEVRFDSKAELHLFRIIQEATNNACKHSEANRITISGEIKEDEIFFTIEDDGLGLPYGETIDFTNALVNNHFGMAGMFERAVLIDAVISITSKPNVGTKVDISWKPNS